MNELGWSAQNSLCRLAEKIAPHRATESGLIRHLGHHQLRPLKREIRFPETFGIGFVGVYEFDRSLAERCKPFLLDDYLPASPEHHRASLDSWRRIWDWK